MIFPIPVIQIGRVAIQLPGLTLLFGYWMAMWLAAREARRIGLKEDDVYSPGFYAAIAGIIGARLWYVVAHWEAFVGDPLSIVALNLSTLDGTGGLIMGLLAGGIYVWRRKLISARWFDALSPGTALMLATASLANLFSGEAYGAPTTLPWAIMLWDTERHPTQVYEMLAALATLVVLLVALRSQYALAYSTVRQGEATANGESRREASHEPSPGTVTLLFLALYFSQRVFLEAFRADSVELGGWRVVQVIGLVVLGVSLVLLSRRMVEDNQRLESEKVT
jgi:prolipoprotein diacylglyceryltransferase